MHGDCVYSRLTVNGEVARPCHKINIARLAHINRCRVTNDHVEAMSETIAVTPDVRPIDKGEVRRSRRIEVAGYVELRVVDEYVEAFSHGISVTKPHIAHVVPSFDIVRRVSQNNGSDSHDFPV